MDSDDWWIEGDLDFDARLDSRLVAEVDADES